MEKDLKDAESYDRMLADYALRDKKRRAIILLQRLIRGRAK